MLSYRRITEVLKLGLVSTGMSTSLVGTSNATTWITVFDTTINIDKVEYITPVVCIQHRDGSEIDIVKGFCTFSVVFEGRNYTLEKAQSGNFTASGAEDQLTFAMPFGSGEKMQTYQDAEKALRPFRDLLPR